MAAVVAAGIGFDAVAIIAVFFTRVDAAVATSSCPTGVAAFIIVEAVAVIALLALLDDAIAANGTRGTRIKAR